MQNIIEILKEFGLEVSEDKKADFEEKVRENYKTTSEVDKKVGKLETERDDLKLKFDDASETIKGFEGVDLEKINTDLADYKKRAEDAEKDFTDKLYQRDFEDALTTAMGEHKFTSTFAQKAIMEEIKSAGLKLKDGKILGLGDYINTIKEKDSSAFVDEQQQAAQEGAAKFTQPLNQQGKSSITNPWKKDTFNLTEQGKIFKENPDLAKQLMNSK